MKKIKKVLAMIMAMAMIMGMSVTAFASGVSGTAASITNISYEDPDNIVVTAYQIIDYDPNGTYGEVIPNTIDKTADGKLNVTAANLEDLYANHLRELTTVNRGFQRVGETDEFTNSTLDYGTWMVIIEGSEKYLYNPAVISVWQDTDGTKKYGTMDLVNDQWTEGSVYAKKSEPTITKEVITQNVQGVQYGEILQFKVTADVPSYMSNKTVETYTIKDEMTGLSLVNQPAYLPSASIDGASVEELTNLVNKAIVDGEGLFEISGFSDQFFEDYAGKQIVITYYAKVTSDAKINVDELNNKATLEYDTNDGTQTKYEETNHYTFGIDTSVTGSNITENKTGEFIKVDADGNVSYNETTNAVEVTEGNALNGAEFQLHIGSEDGELFVDAAGNATFTTSADGRLEINGLDPDVDYYLIETKAPDGYTLNATPIKVEINATFDGDKLTGYQVVMTVRGEDGTYGEANSSTNYGYSVEEGKTTLINSKDNPSNPLGFQNTKLQNLPSTGGIGTTIFTIGGIVIMVAAAGLYFANRRKNNAE